MTVKLPLMVSDESYATPVVEIFKNASEKQLFYYEE